MFNTPTLWPSKFTPGYKPKRNDNVCPQKSLGKDVHSSICHDNPKWKTKYPLREEWYIPTWKNIQQQKSNACSNKGESHRHDTKEEARHKRTHTTWFHSYKILSQAKLIYSDRTREMFNILIGLWIIHCLHLSKLYSSY